MSVIFYKIIESETIASGDFEGHHLMCLLHFKNDETNRSVNFTMSLYLGMSRSSTRITNSSVFYLFSNTHLVFTLFVNPGFESQFCHLNTM